MRSGPHTFHCLYRLHSVEDVGEIKLQCIIWEVKVSDLDFADDAVIFSETLDIILGVIDVLNEESVPLRLWVS